MAKSASRPRKRKSKPIVPPDMPSVAWDAVDASRAYPRDEALRAVGRVLRAIWAARTLGDVEAERGLVLSLSAAERRAHAYLATTAAETLRHASDHPLAWLGPGPKVGMNEGAAAEGFIRRVKIAIDFVPVDESEGRWRTPPGRALAAALHDALVSTLPAYADEFIPGECRRDCEVCSRVAAELVRLELHGRLDVERVGGIVLRACGVSQKKAANLVQEGATRTPKTQNRTKSNIG